MPSKKTKEGMTVFKERFVDEYLIDLNASAAVRRAGSTCKDSSLKQTGHIMLKDPAVARAIEKAMAERAKRTKVDQDLVIRGLLAEARNQGEGSTHSARVQAWTMLGKHLGMFRDNVDVNVKARVTLEELLRDD